MSIKIPDFKLDYVFAIEGHEELGNSANKPVIVTAINKETGVRSDYVVKLNASERMHVEARMLEILGAFIAIELKIPVVVPAVIEIGQDFCATLIGKTYFQKAGESLGYNVGSEYRSALSILANNIPLTESQEKIAQHIFAFDLLIENVDRNNDKPNMLTDGHTLIVLDHELGFGFMRVLPFLRNQKPWELGEAELQWITKHCLYNRLKGKVSELDSFCEKLVTLDAEFWDRAKSLIPPEWIVDDLFNGIKKHIEAMIINRDEFKKNVKHLLA
ncbi:HipA family kinase [Olivibacter sp. CPCC 100613]|uniref:HipA family kinase n=1 Tax=Olivibacter sp. CPCC 100613 TaxID=3079931 RepID=UPI002FFC98DD